MKTMTGNNKLVVCEAEMKKMIEHYINSELFGTDTRVKVNSVRYNNTGGINTNTFEISLGEWEPKEESK